ncbi:MAG: hypothetical protein ACOC45_04320 [Alkalispirochaetaceae bacterium]
MQQETLLELAELIAGGIATFLAVTLWAHTRDTAWLLVIIAVIVRYADLVFVTLESFGIATLPEVSIFGLPVFRLLLVVLWPLFLGAAFMVVLLRKRRL